jgi:hypothetical protein
MANRKNVKTFTRNQNRKHTSFITPVDIEPLTTATAGKNEKKQSVVVNSAVPNPELERLTRITLQGIKRSVICGSIVLIVLIILYLVLR